MVVSATRSHRMDAKSASEIRHYALLRAVRICKGVTGLSERLGVSRTRVSNWINQPHIEVPYQYLLQLEEITGVSIECLAPNEPANKIIIRLRALENHFNIEMDIDDIIIEHTPPSACFKKDQSILVDAENVLIYGLEALKAHRRAGLKRIKIKRLDLKAISLGLQTLKLQYAQSEQIAIGLRLEQLLPNRQGQRNDLGLKSVTESVNPKNSSLLLPSWGEVKGRKNIQIAKILGLSANTYYRAKQIYLYGSFELINAWDEGQISIFVAAKIAKLPKDKQFEFMQANLKKGVKSL